VTAPEEPSKKQKADYDKLSKLPGDAFDKQFAKHMVISEYTADSKKKDPTASYASDTLPTLQKHLEMAQSLVKSLGGR
jgi:putative membrane protein